VRIQPGARTCARRGLGSDELFSPGSRRYPQDRTCDSQVRTPAPSPPLIHRSPSPRRSRNHTKMARLLALSRCQINEAREGKRCACRCFAKGHEHGRDGWSANRGGSTALGGFAGRAGPEGPLRQRGFERRNRRENGPVATGGTSRVLKKPARQDYAGVTVGY